MTLDIRVYEAKSTKRIWQSSEKTQNNFTASVAGVGSNRLHVAGLCNLDTNKGKCVSLQLQIKKDVIRLHKERHLSIHYHCSE